MIRDLMGRDLSRDLDRHITGNYGEDQFTRGGRMRKSEHYGPRHPAVAAVACPVCEVAAGVPCVRARDRQPREGHGTETHVGRVRLYDANEAAVRTLTGQETHVTRVRKFEREALPGEPGSVLPPSPVDTDNDCAP